MNQSDIVTSTISVKHIDIFISNALQRKGQKWFVLPTMLLRTPEGLNVRMGSRRAFVDFPRFAYDLILGILHLTSAKYNEAKGSSDKRIEAIRKEKSNKNTELGFLTRCLEFIGVKWNILYQRMVPKAHN